MPVGTRPHPGYVQFSDEPRSGCLLRLVHAGMRSTCCLFTKPASIVATRARISTDIAVGDRRIRGRPGGRHESEAIKTLAETVERKMTESQASPTQSILQYISRRCVAEPIGTHESGDRSRIGLIECAKPQLDSFRRTSKTARSTISCVMTGSKRSMRILLKKRFIAIVPATSCETESLRTCGHRKPRAARTSLVRPKAL